MKRDNEQSTHSVMCGTNLWRREVSDVDAEDSRVSSVKKSSIPLGRPQLTVVSDAKSSQPKKKVKADKTEAPMQTARDIVRTEPTAASGSKVRSSAPGESFIPLGPSTVKHVVPASAQKGASAGGVEGADEAKKKKSKRGKRSRMKNIRKDTRPAEQRPQHLNDLINRAEKIRAKQDAYKVKVDKKKHGPGRVRKQPNRKDSGMDGKPAAASEQ